MSHPNSISLAIFTNFSQTFLRKLGKVRLMIVLSVMSFQLMLMHKMELLLHPLVHQKDDYEHLFKFFVMGFCVVVKWSTIVAWK